MHFQTFSETGELVHQVESSTGTVAVAWHPKNLLLAYVGVEKDRDDRYVNGKCYVTQHI